MPMTANLTPLTDEQRDEVEKNLNLARWALGRPWNAKNAHAYRDYEDARQQAFLGLCEAVRRYDRSRGTKLSTVAHWWMWNRIRSGAREDSMPRTALVSLWDDGGRESLTRGDTSDGDSRSVGESPESYDEEPAEGYDGLSWLNYLPARMRSVVLMRADGMTLAEIGRSLGVTKERVRQIFLKARGRLESMGLTFEALRDR